MDEALVSIIIPVYNAAACLARCLDSVLAQTYTNIQIIAVDDGSTDSSGALCDAYAARDKRLQVVHQKNAGAALARNTALKLTKGEYLGFVDADDYVEPDYVATLVKNMAGCDMVLCGYRAIEKQKVRVRQFAEDVVLSSSAYLERYYDEEIKFFQGLTFRPVIGGYLWNKLFKRQLWGDIQFPAYACNEDTIAVTTYVCRTQKVHCLQACKYNYCIVEDSLSNKLHIDTHVGDVVGMRKKQQVLVHGFLLNNRLQDTTLQTKVEALVLLAYLNVFSIHLRDSRENDPVCTAYLAEYNQEMRTAYPSVSACESWRIRLKFFLLYFAPSFYFQLGELKNAVKRVVKHAD